MRDEEEQEGEEAVEGERERGIREGEEAVEGERERGIRESGNSLNAVQLVSRLQDTRIVSRLMRYSTPRSLLYDHTPSVGNVASRIDTLCISHGGGDIVWMMEAGRQEDTFRGIASAIRTVRPSTSAWIVREEILPWTHDSIETVASLYVDAVRSQQPFGPYRLL